MKKPFFTMFSALISNFCFPRGHCNKNKIYVTFLMRGASIFSSNLKMIFYFDINFFFILILANTTFDRIFKIFKDFFSHNKRFFKLSLNYSVTKFTFINHIIKKCIDSILVKVNFVSSTT